MQNHPVRRAWHGMDRSNSGRVLMLLAHQLGPGSRERGMPDLKGLSPVTCFYFAQKPSHGVVPPTLRVDL